MKASHGFPSPLKRCYPDSVLHDGNEIGEGPARSSVVALPYRRPWLSAHGRPCHLGRSCRRQHHLARPPTYAKALRTVAMSKDSEGMLGLGSQGPSLVVSDEHVCLVLDTQPKFALRPFITEPRTVGRCSAGIVDAGPRSTSRPTAARRLEDANCRPADIVIDSANANHRLLWASVGASSCDRDDRCCSRRASCRRILEPATRLERVTC